MQPYHACNFEVLFFSSVYGKPDFIAMLEVHVLWDVGHGADCMLAKYIFLHVCEDVN